MTAHINQAANAPITPALPDWMQHIENTLTNMQKMVRQFIISRPASSIMVDMGGGKTLTTLSALTYITPPNTNILVIAPPTIAATTWTAEIEHWCIPLNTVSLTVNDNGKKLTKQKRYERYEKLKTGQYPPSMYIISEGNLEDLVNYFGDNWPFAIVVCDEAQLFKNYASKRFIALNSVRPYISRIIQLGGTPVPNDVQDIWSQIYLLDGGAALGHNITEFRRRYCEQVMVGDRIYTYPAKPGAQAAIASKITHLALASYNTELAMPEQFIDDHIIELDSETTAEYKELAANAVLTALTLANDEADDDTLTKTNTDILSNITPGQIITLLDDDDELSATISAQNAAVLRMKLLQLASGTVYLDELPGLLQEELDAEYVVNLTNEPDAELGHHTLFKVGNKTAVNIHNDKITALINIINNTDSPILLAYNFQSDKLKINHMLRKAGIDARIFDKSPAMVTSWNKGEIPVMMIHPASAGHGLNLQHGGHTFIWYTLPDSLEHYLQANARLYRPGQKHDVTINRLITANTKDDSQPALLAKKQINQDVFLDGLHHSAANPTNTKHERQKVIDTAAARAIIRHKYHITDKHDPRLNDNALIAAALTKHREQQKTYKL